MLYILCLLGGVHFLSLLRRLREKVWFWNGVLKLFNPSSRSEHWTIFIRNTRGFLGVVFSMQLYVLLHENRSSNFLNLKLRADNFPSKLKGQRAGPRKESHIKRKIEKKVPIFSNRPHLSSFPSVSFWPLSEWMRHMEIESGIRIWKCAKSLFIAKEDFFPSSRLSFFGVIATEEWIPSVERGGKNYFQPTTKLHLICT